MSKRTQAGDLHSTKRKRFILGITPIISTVLLTLVAVGAGGALYAYVTSTTQSYEASPAYTSLMEIPQSYATADSIRIYVLNIGRSAILLDGSEQIYVTSPNGTVYDFHQTGIVGNQISFSCVCSSNSNSTFLLMPHETVEFVLATDFPLAIGYSYLAVVVLGDGSETSEVVTAR